jgi:hypothetical protein
MNLLREYCLRTKKEFLWATNEGFVFLSEYKRPAMVCLTSSHPRQLSICNNCVNLHHEMIVELIVPEKDQVYKIHSHSHCEPNINLLDHLKKLGFGEYEVCPMSNLKDIESWMWEFFIFHNALKYSQGWKNLLGKQKDNKIEEQMCWCATKSPSMFVNYYNMYENLTIGRTYLAIA